MKTKFVIIRFFEEKHLYIKWLKLSMEIAWHLETFVFVLNHNYFKYDGKHYKQIMVVRLFLPLVLF